MGIGPTLDTTGYEYVVGMELKNEAGRSKTEKETRTI